MRGIVFFRGKSTLGGGLYCDGGSVTLEVCSIKECKGGGLYVNKGNAHLYAVSFADNEASEGKRSDVTVNDGTVTIYFDLPSDIKGSAVAQSDLEVSVLSTQGWISGPFKSFALPGATKPPAPAPTPPPTRAPVRTPTRNPNSAITPPPTPSPTSPVFGGALDVNSDASTVPTYMMFVAFCLLAFFALKARRARRGGGEGPKGS